MGQVLVWYFCQFFPNNLCFESSQPIKNRAGLDKQYVVTQRALNIDSNTTVKITIPNCRYSQFFSLEPSPTRKKYCTLWKYCCQQTCILCLLFLQNMHFLGLRAISRTQVARQIKWQGICMMHPRIPVLELIGKLLECTATSSDYVTTSLVENVITRTQVLELGPWDGLVWSGLV